MKQQEKQFKVRNGEVQLAVSEVGQGQTLVFFNGGGATQVTWQRLIAQLDGQYRVVTFDFRNHGKTNAVQDTSIEGFLADAETIMDEVAGERAVVVGWSLGADLAVWYAARHPRRVAGLFLIDGAVPVNLVTDPEDVRRRLNTPVVRIAPLLMYLVGMGYRLSPDAYATLTIDLNKRREQLLSAYEQLDCPVEMVLATMSGGQAGERAERNNALWRAGAERLEKAFPGISLHWLDNNHLLPLRMPTALAHLLDTFVKQVVRDGEAMKEVQL